MPASSAVSQETAAALCVLDRSQWHILLIVVGVLISYGLTGEQRRQLLWAAQGCEASDGCTKPLRLVSSLFILCALLFFFGLSEQTARTETDSRWKDASHQANLLASGLVLLAGIVRLWDLLCLQE